MFAVGGRGKTVQALQHTKGAEPQAALGTGRGVKAADRARCKVAGVFVGPAGAVQQIRLYLFKITLSDVCLACHHQSVPVGDLLRDAVDGRCVVGDVFAHIAVSAGGGPHQTAVFIFQLHGQAIVFVHEHHRAAPDKGRYLLHRLGLIEGKQGDGV